MIENSAALLHPEPDGVLAPAWPGARCDAAGVVDLGGDPVERALRLGQDAIGRALVFTATGSALDAEGPFPGGTAFLSEMQPVRAPDGETLGTLRAVAPSSAGGLDQDGRRALCDVAALIGGDLATRARIGLTDHVTGLPNRKCFDVDFPRFAESAERDHVLMLVTLADARHYNEILRALGHACAETFVRRGVEMLRGAIGPSRRLFHVSVLSFAFWTPRDLGEASAREIVSAFASPVVCDGLPVTTRIGVGLTRIDPAAPRPSETLRSALAAAQDSRRVHRGFAHYDRRSDEAHLRAFALLRDLETALGSEGQLSLAYQPRIDLSTGAASSAEALIRWTHPTLGAISPAEFVPLAETTALMGRLTRWVLDRASRQAAAWAWEKLDVRLSLNVSPTDLHDGAFLSDAIAILADNEVDPARIEFEFTENTLTSTEAGVRDTIDALRELGSTVAIDDFGTGYSNLDYLTRLPVDVLKLDRSFVQPLEGDARRRALVRSMIDLSHELGFRIVAEGVETATVYDTLVGWGCDEAQGYFMSRPLAARDFAAFAAAR